MITRGMLVVLLFTSGFVTTAPAQEKKADDAMEKAVALVQERLKELKSPQAHVEAITDSPVLSIFPAQRFVVVRYRLWPVAIAPPKDLKSQNLFAVDKSGKLQHLTDAKGLEAFFRTNLAKATNQNEAVRTWLRLSQEFVQDGFYKFAIEDKIETLAGSSVSVATGTATVVPEGGNKGTLRVSLTFGREGEFGSAHEENKIVRGMRPRCQATLLLHPDPTVRAVAEQDLLVMGRAAKPYLDEQRAVAGPELRRAIDRLWQRIVQVHR